MSQGYSQKDSSFVGFLNGYSSGNVAVATRLNIIVSTEVHKITETIDSIIKVLDSDQGKQLSEQLSLAKETLLSDEESNVTKLLSFSRVLEVGVILYSAVDKTIDPDKRERLSSLFDRLIVEYITVVKKVGNSALLESATRLIHKLENKL